MEIIVYYSNRGNSREFARLLEEKKNIAVIELVETKKRKGLIGFFQSGFEAIRKKESKLVGEPWKEINKYEKIYLIMPIWTGNTVPAINTFISNAEFKNKKVILITMQADPKFNGRDLVIERITSEIALKGGEILADYKINGTGPFEEKDLTKIEKQFKEIEKEL